MRASRMLRIASSESAITWIPSKVTSPPTMRPGGLIILSSASTIVDLPLPDSPTRPKRSPAHSDRLKRSTAFTTPRRIS